MTQTEPQTIDLSGALLGTSLDHTVQRSYTLTGDATFLEPYLAAKESIAGQPTTLHQLSAIKTDRANPAAPAVQPQLALSSRLRPFKGCTGRAFIG